MFDLELPIKYKEIISNETFKRFSELVGSILAKIDQKIICSRDKILKKYRMPENDFDIIVNYLTEENLIDSKIIKENSFYFLTNKGNEFYNDYIKKSTIIETSDDIEEEIENLTILEGFNKEESVPSVIGCFVADKEGKTLLTFEIFEGALETYLRRHIEEEQLEMELIPLFISALEKFSREINVKNLSGLKITGTNIKVQTFLFRNSTVTFFFNPDINLKKIKKKILSYFKYLFAKYEKDFEVSFRTGMVDNLNHLKELGQELLEELNNFASLVEFKNIVDTLDTFDLLYAITLKSKLKKLREDFSGKISIIDQKISVLEKNLQFAIESEDLPQLKDIINKAQQLESNLTKF